MVSVPIKDRTFACIWALDEMFIASVWTVDTTWSSAILCFKKKIYEDNCDTLMDLVLIKSGCALQSRQ